MDTDNSVKPADPSRKNKRITFRVSKNTLDALGRLRDGDENLSETLRRLVEEKAGNKSQQEAAAT